MLEHLSLALIILLTEFLLTPEISEKFLASKSRQKNSKISQNFFSEIWE